MPATAARRVSWRTVGLAPVVFTVLALAPRDAPPLHFDLQPLEDFWLRRKCHHTMSSTLVWPPSTKRSPSSKKRGLDARWARHEQNHRLLVDALTPLGLSLLPPAGEAAVDAQRGPRSRQHRPTAVRRYLLETSNMEIGAGLGPLASKIFRVRSDGGEFGAAPRSPSTDRRSSPRLLQGRRGHA